MTLFDNAEIGARDAVLERMAGDHRAALDAIREHLRSVYARRLACTGYADACVTADDARAYMDQSGLVLPHNNILGSLFKASGWQFTGRRVKSRTPGSHANEIKCWRWVGQQQKGAA